MLATKADATRTAPHSLHPQLLRDSFAVTTLDLCAVRLMDNRHFPWMVLVPQRWTSTGAPLLEWMDLDRADQHRLSDEIGMVSHIAQALFTPDKLNIAALGNQVPQLHVHLIARYRHDACWPKPVWGGPTDAYAPVEAEAVVRDLKTALDSLR